MRINQLFVKIGADIKEFEYKMAKVRQSMQNVGQELQRVGRTMSTAVTAPLVLAGAAAIKFASDAEETQSKFNVVFGEMAGQANAWAEQFAAAVGRARTDVKAWMAELQDTFVPLGYTREEAAKMSQTLTQLAVDVASFNNAADADVIRDFQSALVGNHETVRKYGIIITEAALKQEAYASGIAAVGAELTEQQKVQARMQLLLKGTADAQGDAIRTAGSFANQLKALRAALKNTAETIGQMLMPHAAKLLAMIRSLLDWFNNLNPTVKSFVVALGAVAAAIGPLILLIGTFSAAIAAISAPVLIAVGAIGALVAAGTALYLNWEKVKYYGLQAWGELKRRVLSYIADLLSGIAKFADIIPGLGAKVRSLSIEARRLAAQESYKMFARQVEFAEASTKKATGGISEAMKKAQEAVAKAANVSSASAGNISNAMAKAGSSAKSAAGKIKEAAEEARPAWEGLLDVLSTKLSIVTTRFERTAMSTEHVKTKAQELADKIDNLNARLEIQKKIVDTVNQAYQESVKTKGENAKETLDLLLKLEEEKKAQAELEKEIRETSDALKEQADELRNLAAEVDRVEQKYREELAKAAEEYQQKVAEVNAKLAEDERRLTEQYEQEVERRAAALRDFVGLFDEVTTKEVSGEQLLKNLRDQVATFEDWQENIQALAARGVDEGLIAELREMGPKAAPEIAALNTLTDQQLLEYVSLWREKTQLAREEAKRQLEGQRIEMLQKLQELRIQAAQQLEQYRIEWEKKNREIRKNAEEEIKRIEERYKQITEDSTVYGQNLVENFVEGIDSRMELLRNRLEEMAAMIDSYMPHSPAKVGPLKKIREWGPALISELVKGIRASMSRVEVVSADIARAVQNPVVNVAAPAVAGAGRGDVYITIYGNDADEIFNKLKRELVRAGYKGVF